ncbi:C40 family peptidase [Paenibacillus pasadenensis]|uniref:Invasion associated protein p60 n=1 Tax=Paenibacillus pasadenensis TaxID=217090 RepID=A0A2N5N543_9BACL|nr:MULTISPECIES: SH3 domain-containing C40 family peptidase [Paenibacillus]PLT45468.1 Invasion associated protein p60 [Paenibacillus pasadenensis]
MNNSWASRNKIKVALSAAIAFGAVGGAWIPASSTVSAAASYETKITYGVNMRVQASAGSDKIRMLKKGEQVHVVGQANAYWLHVLTPRGESGYISSSSQYSTYSGPSGSTGGTTSPGVSSKRDQVVSIAQSYIGRVSYGYGVRNESRLIFDCSSFTQFVYGQAGVSLKWGTSVQKSQGQAVSRANLQKGDLIFFDTVGSNNGVINHVGIYMGNGQFIHNTPSADGVAIHSLTSGWWKDRYVSSRSVI